MLRPPLPNHLHYEHTRRALLARKDVLCEIPLAMSYSDGAALVALAQTQGRRLMVAHSMRFQPALVWLHAQIAAGGLHLRHVLARMLMFRLVNVGWTGRKRSWTDNILWHQGGHLVDSCLWMLGTDRIAGRAGLHGSGGALSLGDAAGPSRRAGGLTRFPWGSASQDGDTPQRWGYDSAANQDAMA